MVPLEDGTFCVLASLDDYGDDYRILTRKATYKDICNWVMETYGVPIKNVDISRAKDRCGLARKMPPGYRQSTMRPEREDMIIEAFRHFGMLPKK